MNKRFFTLMAAVMLSGASMSEAFAANPVLVPIDGGNHIGVTSVAKKNLANGLKFVIAYDVDVAAGNTSVGNYNYVNVVPVAGTNYVTRTSRDEASIDDAAVFEVKNYSGGTFELWVNGKQFVTSTLQETAYDPTDPDKIVKKFVAKNGASVKTATDFDGIFTYQVGTAGVKVWGAALIPGTINEDYTAAEFNDFNSKGTTLSFDAPNLVGNVFEGLTPITFTSTWGSKFPAGTYFVSGSASDIAAFIKSGATNVNIQRAAAKLQFAYISTSRYDLDAIASGEGYKLIMLAGSEFYSATNADPNRANFTANTVDNLNNDGQIKLSATVTVSGTSIPVVIAAVKTSGSDASSYVTTLKKSGSALTAIHPTLGSNTYYAASEFLSSEESVYNIYFTSSVESVKDGITTEYHKYLTVGSKGTNFVVNALAADNAQLDSPLAQWIATGFDGKYTLTLTNRQTLKKLVLKLTATATDGIYEIVSAASGDFAQIANIDDLTSTPTYNDKDLAGKTIKLIKKTTTKTDGFLDLTKEEMAAGVVLAFSGKNDVMGETTFYAAADVANNKLYPSLNSSNWLKVTKAEDANGDVDYVQNEIAYAYINAAGQVVTDKKDVLAMPTYKLSYTYWDNTASAWKTKYVKSQQLDLSDNASEAIELFFQQSMDGCYVMTNIGGHDEVSDVAAAWTSTNVKVDAVGNSKFESTATLYNPEPANYSHISVIVYTNEDRTSLEAVSRHATLENKLGSVSLQENKNGILEGILAAEGMTFWLDTADSETTAPAFYISKGITAAEEEAPATKADEAPAMRNFLFYAADSLYIFNEGSALATTNEAYRLENTSDLKAIFRPAALIAEDTLTTVVDGKDVTLKKGAVKPFQFGIVLADEDVEGEYVIYSKANPSQYLYSHNGKLGFGSEAKAMVFTIGEGDATANEAIAAESGVQVIGGQGVVTVQGAAGKVVTVANILGQTIANQVAASDNVTIAVPAGIVVVAVDGEATKVVVK